VTDLDELVAQMTVDAYDDEECMAGIATVIGDEMPLPCAAEVLGIPVGPIVRPQGSLTVNATFTGKAVSSAHAATLGTQNRLISAPRPAEPSTQPGVQSRQGGITRRLAMRSMTMRGDQLRRAGPPTGDGPPGLSRLAAAVTGASAPTAISTRRGGRDPACYASRPRTGRSRSSAP